MNATLPEELNFVVDRQQRFFQDFALLTFRNERPSVMLNHHHLKRAISTWSPNRGGDPPCARRGFTLMQTFALSLALGPGCLIRSFGPKCALVLLSGTLPLQRIGAR